MAEAGGNKSYNKIFCDNTKIFIGPFLDCKVIMSWLWRGSIVVEHSTHNPKIEGSNPAAGTAREKIVKKCHAEQAPFS